MRSHRFTSLFCSARIQSSEDLLVRHPFRVPPCAKYIEPVNVLDDGFQLIVDALVAGEGSERQVKKFVRAQQVFWAGIRGSLNLDRAGKRCELFVG